MAESEKIDLAIQCSSADSKRANYEFHFLIAGSKWMEYAILVWTRNEMWCPQSSRYGHVVDGTFCLASTYEYGMDGTLRLALTYGRVKDVTFRWRPHVGANGKVPSISSPHMDAKRKVPCIPRPCSFLSLAIGDPILLSLGYRLRAPNSFEYCRCYLVLLDSVTINVMREYLTYQSPNPTAPRTTLVYFNGNIIVRSYNSM